MTRRGIDLPEDTWRKLKAHAAVRGQTLSALFGDMAHDALSDRQGKAMRAMTPEERSSTGARLEADEEIRRLKRELAKRPGDLVPETLGPDVRTTGEPILPATKRVTSAWTDDDARRARQKVIDEALRKAQKGKKP